LKIILATNHFFSSHQAGTEQYVLKLAKGIQAEGDNCTVLIPHEIGLECKIAIKKADFKIRDLIQAIFN
jgi:hypothetical protein